MISAKDLCILGGLFTVFRYGIDLCADICRHLVTQTSWYSLDFAASCLDNISQLSDIVFIVLFFMCFFGKKFVFLQKLEEKFPKTSVYLFYLGWVGYVLFAIDILVFIVAYYIEFSESVQEYIAYVLVITNICCIAAALITATRQVFFAHKTKQDNF